MKGTYTKNSQPEVFRSKVVYSRAIKTNSQNQVICEPLTAKNGFAMIMRPIKIEIEGNEF